MALAALAPLLGGIIGPAALSSMGIAMPGMLAEALGAGLGGLAATGNPITGLEDAAGGALANGLTGMLMGGAGAGAAATGSGAAAGGANAAATNALTSMTGGSAAPLATVAASAPTDLNAQIAASMGGGAGGAAAAAPSTLSNLGGLNFNVGGNYAAGAVPAGAAGGAGNAANSALGWIKANPLLAGVGGLGLLSALDGKAKTPADPTYTSPGLTPYKNQTYVAPPAGFQPGISPEAYYLSNPSGYADGGPVVANPYQQAAPGMVDLQLGLSPQSIVQRQLLSQTLQPAQRYATGGSIPQLPKPQMSVDNRGMSMLQREAMRSAMPYPHPAMATPASHMAAPHAMSAHIAASPLGMAAGGSVPGAPGGLGGLPGMQVPDIAGDGSSDSIPATIDGTQPALLSSGEHVVSADVVSGLGNGSTEAGSKQLHAMANRVRMAKTGSRAMPKRINPKAVMPA